MNLRTVRLWAATWLLIALGVLVAACGGGSSATDDAAFVTPGSHSASHGMTGSAPAGAIAVALTNWAISPATPTAKAGKVTFWAVHDMAHAHSASEGGVTHDLQVFRKLPGGGLELVGQVNGLKMGEAKALSLELPAGEYELACNVVEEVDGKQISHYAQGMHTTFRIT